MWDKKWVGMLHSPRRGIGYGCYTAIGYSLNSIAIESDQGLGHYSFRGSTPSVAAPWTLGSKPAASFLYSFMAQGWSASSPVFLLISLLFPKLEAEWLFFEQGEWSLFTCWFAVICLVCLSECVGVGGRQGVDSYFYRWKWGMAFYEHGVDEACLGLDDGDCRVLRWLILGCVHTARLLCTDSRAG